jgi:predicted nucleic acid-binding protein
VTRGLTLDTGALIAFERGDARMRSLVAAASRGERALVVPTPALAEAWRGGNTRWLNELLTAAVVEPADERLARLAGEVLARTATSDAVDALVAVSAAQRGDIIATSDPADLQRLADDLADVRVWPL